MTTRVLIALLAVWCLVSGLVGQDELVPPPDSWPGLPDDWVHKIPQKQAPAQTEAYSAETDSAVELTRYDFIARALEVYEMSCTEGSAILQCPFPRDGIDRIGVEDEPDGVVVTMPLTLVLTPDVEWPPFELKPYDLPEPAGLTMRFDRAGVLKEYLNAAIGEWKWESASLGPQINFSRVYMIGELLDSRHMEMAKRILPETYETRIWTVAASYGAGPNLDMVAVRHRRLGDTLEAEFMYSLQEGHLVWFRIVSMP